MFGSGKGSAPAQPPSPHDHATPTDSPTPPHLRPPPHTTRFDHWDALRGLASPPRNEIVFNINQVFNNVDVGFDNASIAYRYGDMERQIGDIAQSIGFTQVRTANVLYPHPLPGCLHRPNTARRSPPTTNRKSLGSPRLPTPW